MAIDYSLMTKKTKENEKLQQEGYEYIVGLASDPIRAALSSNRKAQERAQAYMDGEYFAQDAYGVYDVLPKRYRDSQSYQDMSKIFSGVDISDRTQRENARKKLDQYLYQNKISIDSDGVAKQWAPSQAEKTDYTAFDLAVVQDAYQSLLNANFTQKMLDQQAENDIYDGKVEEMAIDAAAEEGNPNINMENNPVGAYYLVKDDLQTRINDLTTAINSIEGNQEKGEKGLDFLNKFSLLDVDWLLSLSGTDTKFQTAEEGVKGLKEELDELNKLMAAVDRKITLWGPQDYDPNYMLHTYVGGTKAPEVYAEEFKQKAEEAKDERVDFQMENPYAGYDPTMMTPDMVEAEEERRAKELELIETEDDLWARADALKLRAYYEEMGARGVRIDSIAKEDPEFAELARIGRDFTQENEDKMYAVFEDDFMTYTRYDQLETEEKEIINYLLGYYVKYGEDAPVVQLHEGEDKTKKEEEDELNGLEMAKAYYDSLVPELNRRYAEEQYEDNYEATEGKWAWGSLLSAVSGFLGGFQSAAYTLKSYANNLINGEDIPLDPNSPGFSLSRASDTFMEAGTVNLNETEKAALQLITDAAVVVGVSFTGPAAPYILAVSNGGNAAYRAAQSGASAEEALLFGVVTGTIDALTGKVGTQKIVKTIKAGKTLSIGEIKEIAKQAGIELSEGIVSDIAVGIAERKILGEDSEYERYVRELMSQYGLSEAEARQKADEEFYWNRIVESAMYNALGGAISSGLAYSINIPRKAIRNGVEKWKTGRAERKAGSQVMDAQWEPMVGREVESLGPEAEAHQRLISGRDLWGPESPGMLSRGAENYALAGGGMLDGLPEMRRVESEAYGRLMREMEGQKGRANPNLMRREADGRTWDSQGQDPGQQIQQSQLDPRMRQRIDPQIQQSQLDPRMRQGIDQPGTAERNALSENQSALDQQGGQESLRARRVPELSRNDVNIVLKGELTEAYLKKTGKSMKEFLRQVEGANEVLLEGRNRLDRQRTVESLMADEVLRNVEAGEVKSPEGKRDFKYLEQKRETSLTRKKLDRRLEEYERREAEAVEALRTERGLGQAELGQVPEMQKQQGPVGMREENIDRGGEGSYDGNWKYNDATSGIESGLTPEKAQEIVKTPKGKRPDPSTYLSKEYMDAHLSQFNEGVSIIMTKDIYKRYIENKPFIGIKKDGTQFVLPKKTCDEIGRRANGKISVYEDALGHDRGHYAEEGGLVRIDIESVDGLNLRIPSGNEAGANAHWIPGGKTDGGIPEAVTDLIKNDPSKVKITELK